MICEKCEHASMMVQCREAKGGPITIEKKLRGYEILNPIPPTSRGASSRGAYSEQIEIKAISFVDKIIQPYFIIMKDTTFQMQSLYWPN